MFSCVRTAVALLLVAAPLACASPGSREAARVRFDEAPVPTKVDRLVNWPGLPVTALEQFQEADRARMEVVERKGAGAGVTGATRLQLLRPATGEKVRLKAKDVPPGSLDGWNNSPRKEIATFQIQAFFLEPVDFVVPTSSLRCVPLERARQHREVEAPSVAGTRCVLINIAVWLEDVTVPDALYDPERFLEDANYAYHLAHFNLLTYLIQARDLRRGNVVVSKHEKDRRVFAIDNGISFGAWFFNWLNPSSYQWTRIRVPALPRDAVQRLRALERGDLDALAVGFQMSADEAGVLRIEKPDPPFDPERGVRIDGTTVQLGLTRSEIDGVWKRIEELLDDVDSGRVGLF